MSDHSEESLQLFTRVEEQLQALQPSQKKLNRQLFADLYPTIKARLEAGVTKKDILALLASCGLKMHPARFKTLLEEEGAKTDGRQTLDERGACDE